MATKKKSKKKAAKKSSVRKKSATVKRPKAMAKKKAVVKKVAKKKIVQKKSAPKKSVQKKTAKKKSVGKKPSGRATVIPEVAAPSRQGLGARSGGQSGDLQGLSRYEEADSESVEELIEEGNSLEADAVKGVEDAGDDEEGEVHTHEVPEDDVPGEYLDEE
jgi:RNA polymerase primary sigma factor